MALNLIMASNAILWLMLGRASGYSIDYFDCRSPTRNKPFARPMACDPFATEEKTTTGTTYEVLTEAETREKDGWSCDIIVSEWRYRCGIFSHLELAPVPHLLLHTQVTWAECRRMVRRLKYIPEGRSAAAPKYLELLSVDGQRRPGGIH